MRKLALIALCAAMLAGCATLGYRRVYVCVACGNGYGSAYDAGFCHGAQVVVEYWALQEIGK